jgi:hypothetical protein
MAARYSEIQKRMIPSKRKSIGDVPKMAVWSDHSGYTLMLCSQTARGHPSTG